MWQVLASSVRMTLLMKMEMTTDEKDIFLAQIIDEHFRTQKENPLYVPIEHLKAKGFDLSDSNNALWRLKENGIVSQYKHCWGFFEVKKSDKKLFVTTGEDKQTDEDVEVYEVKIVPEKISKLSNSERQDKVLVLYLDKNGDLYKEPKGKFCYEMKGKGIPLKILNYFIDHPNTDYQESTATMAETLEISDKQLRTEIGKMKSKSRSIFEFGDDTELIESRQNSGYRLNPNIQINRKD